MRILNKARKRLFIQKLDDITELDENEISEILCESPKCTIEFKNDMNAVSSSAMDASNTTNLVTEMEWTNYQNTVYSSDENLSDCIMIDDVSKNLGLLLMDERKKEGEVESTIDSKKRGGQNRLSDNCGYQKLSKEEQDLSRIVAVLVLETYSASLSNITPLIYPVLEETKKALSDKIKIERSVSYMEVYENLSLHFKQNNAVERTGDCSRSKHSNSEIVKNVSNAIMYGFKHLSNKSLNVTFMSEKTGGKVQSSGNCGDKRHLKEQQKCLSSIVVVMVVEVNLISTRNIMESIYSGLRKITNAFSDKVKIEKSTTVVEVYKCPSLHASEIDSAGSSFHNTSKSILKHERFRTISQTILHALTYLPGISKPRTIQFSVKSNRIFSDSSSNQDYLTDSKSLSFSCSSDFSTDCSSMTQDNLTNSTSHLLRSRNCIFLNSSLIQDSKANSADTESTVAGGTDYIKSIETLSPIKKYACQMPKVTARAPISRWRDQHSPPHTKSYNSTCCFSTGVISS
ncbi:serine-rich adhesin for platelets-like isoform X2 [Prorops nasuta]|uniref:serine-rich adhesin for platelets-like isoform X2 n=1 Tax=Prorops nasuta TaxID=863751 RepID=UPI0034CF5497